MSARLFRFTTENYSPESRVHLWEGHNARALIPLDIRTLESAPMRSRQTNLHLPSIRMADVTLRPSASRFGGADPVVRNYSSR